MTPRTSERPLTPPTIQILLDEEFPTDMRRLKRRFSKSSLIRDLHAQALWTVQNYVYYKAAADEFALAPSASLDPLSRIRPCPHPECVENSVSDLARTLGVYADVVVLPDNVTPLVGMTGDDELSNEEGCELFTMAFALKLLRPLIDAGVVRFVFGEQVMCRRHRTMFDKSVERVAKVTARQVLPEVQILRTPNGFTVTNEAVFSPLQGFTFYAKNEKAHQRLRLAAELKRRATEGLTEELRLAIRETALEMFSADNAGATYVLDSPLIARALTAPMIKSLMPERSRADQLLDLKLPWVADLRITETLELRETASRALARLRALLRKVREIGTAPGTVAAQLREEATEIEAELAALPLARNRQFRTTAAGLGLMFSLVAAAVGVFPASAVGAGGTLLSLLALLEDSESRERHDIAKLRNKPGYVLLRAKELIERRKHS